MPHRAAGARLAADGVQANAAAAARPQAGWSANQSLVAPVVRRLARVAGSDLPCLEVFGAPSTDGDAADDARSEQHGDAETWDWLLVDGQDGQCLQLKVDTAIGEDGERLNELADCTTGFLII